MIKEAVVDAYTESEQRTGFYTLLDERGVQLPVKTAGGLHSIYGTNAFATRLFEPTPNWRSTIASMWGREAENLAYLFSIIDRPRALVDALQWLKEQPSLLAVKADTTHNDSMLLNTNSELSPLCLIEAANLLDQGQLHNWPALKAQWEDR